MYASGITYTGVASVSPAAGTLVAANNGLSVSTVTPGDVVLGQNVGQAGNPAILLSDREIPLDAHVLTMFSGGTFATGNFVRMNGAAGGVMFDIGVNGSSGWHYSVNAGNVGSISFADVRNTPFPITQTWTPTFYNNTPLVNGQQTAYSLNSRWQPSADTGNKTLLDISIVSNVNLAIDDNLDYTAVSVVPRLTSPFVSNIIRGFSFRPTVIGTLAQQPCAIENSVGDVYLCSATAGSNLGHISIRQGQYPQSPTAFIHIGASPGTAGNAPVKLTPGTSTPAPEQGAIEYDAAFNLFFTKNATRENFIVGNSGATAPATTVGAAIVNFFGTSATNFLGTPNSWLAVTISGTVFKIPLYT